MNVSSTTNPHPPRWKYSRIRYLGRLKGGAGFPEVEQGATGWEIPFFKVSDMNTVGNDAVMTAASNTVSRETARRLGATIFPAGAVVFPKVGAALLTNKRRLLGTAACIDNNTMALVSYHDDSRFLYYLLQSIDLATLANPGAVPSVNEGQVKDVRVLVPPRLEQHTIADFLDRETARIDALMAKKERLIALLQEKHSALINHVVTRGLDPTVPMKESGVGWLGLVPMHWDILRTKFVARLRSGHTPSRQHPEYWENCTIPWFSLADVWQLREGHLEFVETTEELISELGLANSAARLLPAGTVMVSRTASVGYSGIMSVPMATTQDFVNWVCGPRIKPEYLLYVFRAMSQEFRRLVMGSTHQTIYMPDVGQFMTPLPPVSEQDRIVAHIRHETARIDALVAKVREAIGRLKEYRSALITAAVTGQIDVGRKPS